jgi:hypothetical protein
LLENISIFNTKKTNKSLIKDYLFDIFCFYTFFIASSKLNKLTFANKQI